MRITSEWLGNFVPVPAAEQLEHLFEMAGIGVEARRGEEFTLEVTSNRGDWLSVVGLARELAAITNTALKPELPVAEFDTARSGGVEVEIHDQVGCPRYVAVLIDDVRVGPSPDWMQRRLTACGMRPINNVVDITNYVMLELGQPLHAFDAAHVPEGKIIVRQARAGEKLLTLDGVERELSPQVLLIAGVGGPLAVAGVMGGLGSEVTEQTTSVLLESAHFAPAAVRRSVRHLGLATEASRRFERWTDPNGALRVAQRAAWLLREHAGASPAGGATDHYAEPIKPARVQLRFNRCNAVLGTELAADSMIGSLERLGLTTVEVSEQAVEVEIGTFRRDIAREIDLIEEVARLTGYDHIPATLPAGANPGAGTSLPQRLEARARDILVRCGLSEAISYSLENAGLVAKAGLTPADGAASMAVTLRNPLSDDYTQLRTSLLPSMLRVLQQNARHKSGAVRCFELGRVYLKGLSSGGSAMPEERRQLAVALLDTPPEPHWRSGAGAADFFELKSIVEQLLGAMGTPPPQFMGTADAPFHPGRAATISVDKQEIGVIGELHPEVTSRFDLQQRACVALLDFDALVRHVSLTPRTVPINRQPAASRDVALVVPLTTPAALVQEVVATAAGALLERVNIFDVYSGRPITEGYKSLALSLQFRAADRTLKDTEVDAAVAAVVEAAERQLQAQLRS